MGLFDDLLAEVPAEERDFFTKHPKFATEFQKADEAATTWEKWRASNWDESTGMTKNAVEALRQRDEEIAALRAAQGENEMTWDDMKVHVDNWAKTNGYVRKDELANLSYAKPDQVNAVETKLTNLERGVEAFYANSAHLPLQHYMEFGKPMKMADLLTHMTEKKIADFDQGYQSFTATARAEKDAAEMTRKMDEIRAQAKEEGKREAMMNRATMPDADRGGAPEVTALQARILRRKGAEVPDSVPKLTPGELGSGAAANDAYQAFLKDQANGTKPTMVQ